jgi:hypothetical protein
MASEEWGKPYSNSYVRLLESCHVFRVQDVSDTSHDISILLVNLEHLLCRPCIDITEHLHLEWNLVDLEQVAADCLDACGEHFFPVLVNTILEKSVILLVTDPSIEVSVHSQVCSDTLSLEHVFLGEEDRSDSCFLHLLVDSLNVLPNMMLEAEQPQEDLFLCLRFGKLFVKWLSIVLVGQ